MGGGRRSKVSDAVWEKFRASLQADESAHFTSLDLQERLSQFEGGYCYSMSHLSKLLRQKLGMYYYKPSPVDYRRSEQAEEQLQIRTQATLDALQVMNKDISKMAIGFADETGIQFHQNNARFWSLAPNMKRPINSELGSQKFFGFYAIEGNSSLSHMPQSKAEDFKAPLLAIKEANPQAAGIILFWDNAKAHKKIETWAWEQGIYTIPLPAYSPDLNPLERVWKSTKRWVNQQKFTKKKEELRTLFEQAYDIYKVQISFAEGWIEKMESIFSWNSTNTNPI